MVSANTAKKKSAYMVVIKGRLIFICFSLLLSNNIKNSGKTGIK